MEQSVIRKTIDKNGEYEEIVRVSGVWNSYSRRNMDPVVFLITINPNADSIQKGEIYVWALGWTHVAFIYELKMTETALDRPDLEKFKADREELLRVGMGIVFQTVCQQE